MSQFDGYHRPQVCVGHTVVIAVLRSGTPIATAQHWCDGGIMAGAQTAIGLAASNRADNGNNVSKK